MDPQKLVCCCIKCGMFTAWALLGSQGLPPAALGCCFLGQHISHPPVRTAALDICRARYIAQYDCFPPELFFFCRVPCGRGAAGPFFATASVRTPVLFCELALAQMVHGRLYCWYERSKCAC